MRKSLLIFLIVVLALLALWKFPIVSTVAEAVYYKKAAPINPGTSYIDLIFSPNTNWALLQHNSNGVSRIDLLNTENDRVIKLEGSDEGVAPGTPLFSPSGTKILYPAKAKGEGLTFDYGYSPYFSLRIYDIETGKSMDLRPLMTNKYLAYTKYGPALMGWIDENTIVYRCNPTGGPNPATDGYLTDEYKYSTYCRLNLNNETITVSNTPPDDMYMVKSLGIEQFADYSDISRNRSSNLCHKNLSGDKCIYSLGKFREPIMGEGWLIYELHIVDSKTGEDRVVYRDRGRGRPERVFWSPDDHVYIVLSSGFYLKRVY